MLTNECGEQFKHGMRYAHDECSLVDLVQEEKWRRLLAETSLTIQEKFNKNLVYDCCIYAITVCERA